MHVAVRGILGGLTLLVAVQAPIAQAQRSLAQLRQELVAPWLVTVEGEKRTSLLTIKEIAQESEGSYLLNATYGWTDGVQPIVRIELIQSAQDLRLMVRTPTGALVFLRRTSQGEFDGTLKSNRAADKAVRLERLAEDQLQEKAKESRAAAMAQVFADEDRDWGVAPTKTPRTTRVHAPTPRELPGAKTITTMELRALRDQSPAPILVDVLTGDGHRTLPGARWLREAGRAPFGDAEREQLRLDLEKLTGGRKAAPLVFFCLSSECWLSYNAGLRALELGYANVYWFRGGTAAWQRAGFETRESQLYRR
jgi:PQQ-dependent catabolism-associated CXXCW motif protein